MRYKDKVKKAIEELKEDIATHKGLKILEQKLCSRCKKVFDEEVSDEIDKIARKKNLYGLQSQTKIGVTGNCLDIRIGKKLAQFLELKKGEIVTTYPENKNKLIVTTTT